MLLLSDAQLERARTDRTYPRGRIFAHLQRACDRHLDATPEHLRGLSPIRNLLVWDAFVAELGLMHVVTEDERFLDHLLRFVRTLADGGWRTVEVSEHLHAPIVFSALAGLDDLCGSRLAPGDADTLRRTMVEIAEFLWADLQEGGWGAPERTVWNHNVIAYSAIGLAGLTLDDHRLASTWTEIAIERARRFLEVGVTRAGMTWEGHHYCGYVFKQLGALLQALTTSGLVSEVVVPGAEHEARLHRVPHWYAHDLFPRGKWLQNYNDSHWDPHSSLLGFLLAFARYEPAICAAVWDRLVGMPGRRTFGFDSRFSSLAEAMFWFPPGPVPKLTELDGLGEQFFCPEVGYLSARTGWDDAASVFTFNSGPLVSRIHDHADNNSFTFIARGLPLVVDSGSANDPVEGSPSSSLGHNVVFVDGTGEGTAGGGMGVSGTILGAEHTDDLVAVVGDATESYGPGDSRPVRHALRHAAFVKGPVPYLVTYDDIDEDGGEHRYEYVLHVPSGDGSLGVDGAFWIGTNTGEPAGRARLLHPPGVQATMEPYRTQRRPRGPYNQHVVWRLATRAVNPQFVVLLLPEPAPGEEPDVELSADSERVVVRLRWSSGTDELTFTPCRHAPRDRVPLPTLMRRS
jgi:hypothetical protein